MIRRCLIVLAYHVVRNAQLADAKDALTSGVIAAEEVYGSLSSLGCDWDALAVVHVEDVSVRTAGMT